MTLNQVNAHILFMHMMNISSSLIVRTRTAAALYRCHFKRVTAMHRPHHKPTEQALIASPNRRRVITAAAVIPLAALGVRSAHANDRVSPDSATAQAVGYVEDANNVDAERYPDKAPLAGTEQWCRNCQLYTGSESEDWAGCAIFPGKQVAGAGWCSAWVPKS